MSSLLINNKSSIYIYSQFGTLLFYYNNNNNNNNNNYNHDNINQIYGFIKSCFTFSKTNNILTYFNNLNIIAFNGLYCLIVLVLSSSLNNISLNNLYFNKLILKTILYQFEIAYKSKLNNINLKQIKESKDINNNYTINNIIKSTINNSNNQKLIINQQFNSFKYFIHYIIQQNILNICHKNIQFMIYLIDITNDSIFYQYLSSSSSYSNKNHIQIKQFILNKKLKLYPDIIKLKTLNGIIWNISCYYIDIWCKMKLIYIEKENNVDFNYNIINKLKLYFENLLIGHDEITMLKYIDKLKTYKEKQLKPKPPLSKKPSSSSSKKPRKIYNKIQSLQ